MVKISEKERKILLKVSKIKIKDIETNKTIDIWNNKKELIKNFN